MHKVIKLLKGKQSGQALVLALALLGVGSLLIAPMLSLMGTGLNAGVIAEDKMDELYACDAGVQDAIWKINNLPDSVPPDELTVQYVWYTYDSDDEPFVNGMEVAVRIQLLFMVDGFGVYHVQSWVGSDDWNDADTKIDAIITTTWLDYTGITNHVVTSQGDYEIDDKVNVEPPDPWPDDPNGARSDYDGAWPTPQALIDWYSRDVDKDNPYPDVELDLDGVDTYFGPAYIDGDFSIVNSSNTEATLYLTGTIYVTGDILIGATGKDFYLDLDGINANPSPDIVPQTIFVESYTGVDPDTGEIIPSKYALEIGGKTTMTGSGCIIAVGSIKFQPKMEADPLDYILVLSVEGETTMFPSGDFYGTLAGSVFVDVKSGETPSISWNGPPPDLNFPGSGGGGGMIWGIHTWQYWKIGDETP